ncbi:Nuclear pore complex protein [Paragonimus skrjabini miyazakii]|uniref:Nuclear pore complex protein n=1 Tax=Paragonimus skrjabini miyazakii TaxID=59628 RepID=A0A8S9YQH9_9TREM|nr:Nuclear pore complex protein [Paragonimus skrjabini miyazakii]
MACITALTFCISHRGNPNEEFLVHELSKVRSQVSKGLQYFSEPSRSDVPANSDLKDHVKRFLSTLSAFLNLSENICHEIFIHFLATHAVSEEGCMQSFITVGRIHNLLIRIRSFYWQERLALCGLLRLALCSWHESWSSIADVLFAMTNFEKRDDMIDVILTEYCRTASAFERLIKDRKCFSAKVMSGVSGFTDLESGDEFEALVAQHLAEQLEMLHVLLVGVHASPLACNSVASQFTKLLEAFWSQSFGLGPVMLQSLVKHRATVDRICFLQTLILIRSARLDSPSLFRDVLTNGISECVESKSHKLKRSASSIESKPSNRSKNNTAATTSAADGMTPHFLSDSRLLNRLLVSLSDLGDRPVHGPLLLFGAVCATSFAPSTPSACELQKSADDHGGMTFGSGESSTTAQLLAGNYGQLAVESLKVFAFLSEQLVGVDTGLPENTDWISDDAYYQFAVDSDLSLIDFCAHVSVFDLLTLLTRDVVLWSLDANFAAHLHSSSRGLFGLPNRTAFIELFSRTLRVVARHTRLASRTPLEQSTTVDRSAGLGCRLAGLIKTLAESFPLDLSILRLCTALMIPNPSTSASLMASPDEQRQHCSDESDCSLVRLVSELVCCLPYLAEPLDKELSSWLLHSSSPWYPQLDPEVGELVSSTRRVLTQPYIVWSAGHQSGAGSGTMTLPAGTHFFVKPDLGLIVWKFDYSLWSVIDHELCLTHDALLEANRLISATSTFRTVVQQSVDSITHDATLRELLSQLERLHEFVRFAAACVQANVHITSCLSMMEHIWPLLMGCAQYVDAWISSFTDSSLLGRDLHLLKRFLFEQMLPTVLDLLTVAINQIASSDSIKLFADHTCLWNRLLNESALLFPRLMQLRDAQNIDPHLALKPNQLTSLLPSPTLDVTATTSDDRPARFRLIASYLNFGAGLWTLLKWLSTFEPDVHHALFAWDQGLELLKGTVFLVVNHLLSDVLKPDEWRFVTVSSKRNYGPLLWAERCLLLLTEILTTNSPDDPDCTNLEEGYDMLTYLRADFTSSYAVSGFPRHRQRHPIVRIQKLTLYLLLNNNTALGCLLSLSSIPLHTLLTQYRVLEHGFALISQSETYLYPQSTDGRLARCVWLALTLVHRLLQLEHHSFNTITIKTSSQAHPSLLSLIRHWIIRTSTRDHYVTVLFRYLDYSYCVGVPRAATSLLKWLTQYTDICLVECLDPHPDLYIRRAVLRRLGSNIDDQVTRADLFDLIAESVLCTGNASMNSKGRGNRANGLLRLLLASQATFRSQNVLGTIEEPWFGMHLSNIQQKYQQNTSPDCLDCCMEVLKSIKDTPPSGTMDHVSVLLCWSVAKLIAALYLQDVHACITSLESRSDFWRSFTGPVFILLNRVKTEKVGLSNMENELCGHVISVLGLAMFNAYSLEQSVDQLNGALLDVVKRLNKEDAYVAWFRLVAKRLQVMNDESPCGIEKEMIVERELMWRSHLSSLHDATCRWKCLLMSQLKMLERSSDSSSFVFPNLNVDSLIETLLQCLRLTIENAAAVHESFALAAQLGTCLTSVLSYHLRCLSLGTSKRSATNRLQLQRIEHHLVELVSLLTHLCPSPEEPAQHIHAELLASCALLLRCSDLSSSGPMSQLDKSSRRAVLLDCALAYVTRLALRQASALVLQLWDVCSESTLICDRLVQTGVLNNLLNTLEQYSKLREGAALSHDILALVSRLVLPPPTWDPSPAIKRLYPDLKKADLSVDLEHTTKTELPMEPEGAELTTATRVSLSGAKAIASYADVLLKAFALPDLDHLVQWIREEEASWLASSTQLPVANGIPDQLAGCTQPVGMGPWANLILAELRFLCLLHDLLGGVNHPFVGPLINSFCVQNAQQLEALLTLWCEPLTNGGSLHSSGQSTLPSISELLHQRVLSPDRIQLAKAVCALFWRAQIADQSLGIGLISCGSGQPNLGMNVLFRSDLSTQSTSHLPEACMSPTRYLPVYGPASDAQFVTSLFQLVERQTHFCAVLLQRSGFRGTVKPTVTTASMTPIKSGIGSPSTVTRKSSSGSPLLIASDAVNSSQPECTGEVELTCVIRHLIGCLSLFIVQLPSLGYLSLLSSEELHQLRSPVQLVFNTPYLADSSPELTFGVLLTLSHSLGHLISKVGGHMKSSQLVPEYTHLLERRCKLLSLLVQAHEMTLTILFSQATLMLASARTPLADKQLLVRELAGELKSSTIFGRPSRRTHLFGSRSGTAHSPGSRSSSTTITTTTAAGTPRSRALRESSHTPPPTPGGRNSLDYGVVGIRLDSSVDAVAAMEPFGFTEAAERFADLLRLTL